MIRALLAVPQTLRNTLGRIVAGADDVEIAHSPVDAIEILLAARAYRPDIIVIMMEGDEMPGIATHVVAEYPHVKVLGITPDAECVALYALQPRLIRIGEISRAGLLDAIRTAVSSGIGD